MTGQPPDSVQASTTTASVAPLRNRDPFATNVLVMINIIIFLLLWTGDPHERAEWYKWGSMSGFAFASGEWRRPLTAIFLHLNWSHVLWNMAILWFFGRLVERKIGHLALLLLYLGAALAGTLSFLISPLSGKIGASAGVLGVMGAFCVLFVRTLPRLPGKRRLILYCSLSISFLSYMAPLPVPLMAHLLGFSMGILGAAVFLRLNPHGKPSWKASGALAMGALIIAYSPLLFLQNPIRLLDDAQAAYHNKQYEKAAALYGKVIASYPTYVHAYVKRALCYFEMHQTERATEDYNKAIELDPQDPYAYTSRAYQRLQTNIHFLARADLEMASRLSKDSSELDILWGMYSIQTGDYSQATAFLTRAIKNQFYPDYAYYYRGLAHCAAGRLDEAEADWRNAANQATDSERKACALGNIGFLYLRRGQWKQAIDHSNRINAMHPDLPCNLLVHLIAAEKMGKMDARSGLGLLKDKMEPEDTWELNLLLPPELRQYLTYCQ